MKAAYRLDACAYGPGWLRGFGRKIIKVAVFLALLPTPWAPVSAQTLMGAEMQVQVVTYDDPAKPMLQSLIYSALIGPGPEFGLAREGHPFLDIVPVSIDISDTGVSFSYAVTGAAGSFTQAAFNGYILTIAPCAEMADPVLVGAVDIALAPARIAAQDNQLFINVAGLSYQPSTRFDISFETRACPVS